MILDNLLRYRQAHAAAFGLSVAHKWLKNGARIVGGIPGPLSHTPICKQDRFPVVDITTLPESGETASQAFKTRLATTRSRLWESNQPTARPL